jgi:hypothetical protein
MFGMVDVSDHINVVVEVLNAMVHVFLLEDAYVCGCAAE